MSIELSHSAAEWLAKKGYDSKMGAQPLARVIQEHIKKPLAEDLLFGKLSKGGIVRVNVKKGNLNLEIQSLEKIKLPPKRTPLLPAR